MILIDVHEPEEIKQLVSKLNIETKIQSLQAGDYVFGTPTVGIERKRIDDLWSSITPPDPSRLWRELEKIKKVYDIPILCVVGLMPYKNTKIKYAKIIGAIASTVFAWKIPVMMFLNDHQFVEGMRVMYNQCTNKRPSFKPLPPKHYSIREIREEMLCCLPGVGRITAKRILKDNPSPMDWVKLDKKKLQKYRLRKKSGKILTCLGVKVKEDRGK